MHYSYKKEKSLDEQISSFFRKAALMTAFTAAVGAGVYYKYEPSDPPLRKPESVDVVQDTRKEDRVNPEVCAMNANLQEIADKTPQLAYDLAIMKGLPISGKTVYEVITNPENDMKSCLLPVPEGAAPDNSYQNHTLSIARIAGTSDYLHESFHAAQDINKGRKNIYKILTVRDTLIRGLLKEAAAVAYQIAAEKEASNRNLAFNDALDDFISTADNEEVKSAFDNAYNASLKQYAGADAETREAKALEAGGKTVVRFLMNGRNEDWRDNYTELATENVNNNLHFFADDGRENRGGYEAERSNIYTALGAVSEKINLIPDEYLGADAERYIAQAFKKMDFSSKKVSAASYNSSPLFS